MAVATVGGTLESVYRIVAEGSVSDNTRLPPVPTVIIGVGIVEMNVYVYVDTSVKTDPDM